MKSTTTPRRHQGFTLVELVIVISVLGILAALVIPKFTDASTTAQTSSVQNTLRSARIALERYKLDHNDAYPAIGDMWTAMTGRTDQDGTINASGDFGPYIKSVPINPFTNSSTVVAFGAGAATDGFEYDVTEQIPLIAVGFNETTETYTAP